jgi:hypothetical protein
MKICGDCIYAKWKKSSNGRRHPTGEGVCTYEWKMTPIPASRYWISGEPHPSGGFIFYRMPHGYTPGMAEMWKNAECHYYKKVE